MRVGTGQDDQITRPEHARRAVVQSELWTARDDDVDAAQRTVEAKPPFTPQQQRPEAGTVQPQLA